LKKIGENLENATVYKIGLKQMYKPKCTANRITMYTVF